MIKIDGRNLSLVSFEERHLSDPKYFEWLTDFEVVRFIGRDEYLKPIQFEKVREYVEDLWQSKHCYFFAIHHSKDDVFIGTAKINYLNEAGLSTRTADIGIMIGDRRYWGKGIATDALFALCQYAFNTQGARLLRDMLNREGHKTGRKHVATLMSRLG